LWRIEKRLYAHGPEWLQRSIRGVFKTAYVAAIAASGRNPIRYIARYRSNRGMSWHHDIHDWLGGYPYESVGPGEVRAYLRDHGFAAEKVVERPAPMAGLFGTGCDEFVARRAASA